MSIKHIYAVMFAVLIATACSPSESSRQQLLDQGCTVDVPDPRACDPADTHKTTVCHIPPGNPANAHTICIGNEAVPAHLDNHGDFVGTCSCTPDGGVVEGDDASTTPPDGGVSTEPDAGTGGDGDGGIVL
jgi:hypothetical protein